MLTKNNHTIANIEQIKRWSPVWIIPIVTLLIGTWIVIYQFSHQGPEITLITTSAEGIEEGKTAIKSRSIDVGIVQRVTLSNDLLQVKIKARMNAGMGKLLHEDSVFWVVKPQIGHEGITGLSTLLSGVYIALQPGSKGKAQAYYKLLDAPPLAPLDAKGLRIILDSSKTGQLNAGDPVLFRGYRVGSVETRHFDVDKRLMRYQLFITAPYDRLVTSNVRFWKDSGIAMDLSASGMRVEMGSLTTLFSGGVCFDVPDGRDPGRPAENYSQYQLFDDQRSIQNSLYTEHIDFLMLFNESIRGLQPGAPVEFRGIRLGSVDQVPFIIRGSNQQLSSNYQIPVLVRFDPERFLTQLGRDFSITQHLQKGKKQGLRASLKSANLLTGSLFIELDFYPGVEPYSGPDQVAGYEVIPTTSSGLSQIQQKLIAVLDKVNALPLNPMLNQATRTLAESQQTLRDLQKTLDNLNQIMSSQAMKDLPQDIQHTLRELNRSMQAFQPGSPTYGKVLSDIQHFDQVLRELQPILRTLNSKSNALIFGAKQGEDPEPKRAK